MMLQRVPSSCLHLLRHGSNLITRCEMYAARRTMFSLARRSITSNTTSQTRWLCSGPLPLNQSSRAALQSRPVKVTSLCQQSTSSGAVESTIAADIQQESDHLSVTVGNENFKASYLWLRDHCRCSSCYEETCHENFVDIVALPDDIRPNKCHHKNGNLHLTWPDDHVTSYSIQWLQDNTPGQRSAAGSSQQLQPFYWDKASLAANLPEDVHVDAVREGDGLKRVMENLHVYGMTFISGVEPTQESTETPVRQPPPPAEPTKQLLASQLQCTSDDSRLQRCLHRGHTRRQNTPLMDLKLPQVRNPETQAQMDKQTTQVHTPVTQAHTVMYSTPTSAHP